MAAANLNALADVAANLFISLPESPQGKPFIDRADAHSPAALLRAMRKVRCTIGPTRGVPLAPNQRRGRTARLWSAKAATGRYDRVSEWCVCRW